MRIRIVESARRDLEEGYAFYESQENGLGDYFLSSVRADIEGLRISGCPSDAVSRLPSTTLPNFAIRCVLREGRRRSAGVRGCRLSAGSVADTSSPLGKRRTSRLTERGSASLRQVSQLIVRRCYALRVNENLDEPTTN